MMSIWAKNQNILHFWMQENAINALLIFIVHEDQSDYDKLNFKIKKVLKQENTKLCDVLLLVLHTNNKHYNLTKIMK